MTQSRYPEPIPSPGPLCGLRVVELAGIGPVPFAAMMLADLGAQVVRVVRSNDTPAIPPEFDVTGRSRRSIALDLKTAEGRTIALDLISSSDVVLEGLRPGVVERLGLGPTECLERRDSLVYGRMTGWGQSGPYAQTAGHDLTYLAVAGALNPIGCADRPPVPPLNVVGDFGGGAMYLAFGILAAVLRARETGIGEVIDASIVDGAASLYAMMRGFLAEGSWLDKRESNLLDGGAPYYRVYRCADGLDIAVGAIEPQFWAELLERIGLSDEPLMKERDDRTQWPAIRDRLAEHFATRPRQDWVDLTAGTDACLAPVLTFAESLADPHMTSRRAFHGIDGVQHPAPAPRFERAGERPPTRAPRPGEHTDAILAELGYDDETVARLRTEGVVS
jgi:alpha-methylacyl-CoA racemase